MEVNLDDADFDRKLGLRLRQYRLACGLTQMALGDALGVSFQMVQKYEKGHSRVSGQSLVKLADLLKVPVTDILGIPSIPPEPPRRSQRHFESTDEHGSQ